MSSRTVVVLLFASLCNLPLQAARVRVRLQQPREFVSSRAIKNLLQRDAARDAATGSVRLSRPRTVARYTTQTRPRLEQRNGIAAGSHLTARLRPGRPMSTRTAQRA